MFERLTEHCYVFAYDGYTDRPNIGLVVGSKYALLYDAGNSENHANLILKSLSDQGLPQPDFVALSHYHWDHSYASHAFECPIIAGVETNKHLVAASEWEWSDEAMEQRIRDGVEIVFCSEMIKREYPDRSKIKVVAADIVFDGRMEIDLGGGVACSLIHCKGPHASDSVLLHVPCDKFVFLGDSNCKDLYGLSWEFSIEHEEDFKKNTDALPYDRNKVDAYLSLLDTLDFTMCISGHAKAKSREALFAALSEDY